MQSRDSTHRRTTEVKKSRDAVFQGAWGRRARATLTVPPRCSTAHAQTTRVPVTWVSTREKATPPASSVRTNFSFLLRQLFLNFEQLILETFLVCSEVFLIALWPPTRAPVALCEVSDFRSSSGGKVPWPVSHPDDRFMDKVTFDSAGIIGDACKVEADCAMAVDNSTCDATTETCRCEEAFMPNENGTFCLVRE